MIYMPINLNTEINIEKLVAINYFEYERDFVFSGKIHNFWEVIPPVYFKIISPLELHSVRPTYGKAENTVIFSFVCSNKKLFKSVGRTIKCDIERKEYITKLIAAAQDAFSTPLAEPYSTKLVKNPKSAVGSENLVKIYIYSYFC